MNVPAWLRRWMTPAEAAEAVHEPDLAALIRDFDATPVEG